MLPQALPIRYLLNPEAHPSLPFGPERNRILNAGDHAVAYGEISTWPGYAPTPLRTLPGVAEALGIGTLWYKDEGLRLGLGSFKALGGIYGVFRVLQDLLKERYGVEDIPSGDFSRAPFVEFLSGTTVTCASAGNHGRAVARGAKMFGCRSVVFLPVRTSPHRVAAIEDLGARTVLVDGGFDDAVLVAANQAEEKGWHVVADTTFPGYEDVPRFIMQGYTVLAREVLDQLPPGVLPTHVFLQAGVGGLAAAVTGHLWDTLGPDRPRIIVVEPAEADCLLASALRGKATASNGTLRTSMECLACREVSALAWQILAQGSDAFVTIPDYVADETVAFLREGLNDDPVIFTQPSGATGLAGLIATSYEPDLTSSLDLGGDSRVLVIGSEGPE